MALTYKAALLTDIAEDQRGLYKADEGGGFVLDVEGMEDTGALRRSLDHIKREREDIRRERDKLRSEKDEAEHKALLATGNVEAITASYEQKLKDREKEEKTRVKAFEDRVKSAAIKETALKLAGEISTVPALMERLIADRLYVDLVDDKPIVRVYDGDGKPSASSVAELRQELLANKEYSGILIATRASGGGAKGGGENSGGNGGAGPKRIADMNDKERIAFFQADPIGFRAQRDAEKAA